MKFSRVCVCVCVCVCVQENGVYILSRLILPPEREAEREAERSDLVESLQRNSWRALRYLSLTHYLSHFLTPSLPHSLSLSLSLTHSLQLSLQLIDESFRNFFLQNSLKCSLTLDTMSETAVPTHLSSRPHTAA